MEGGQQVRVGGRVWSEGWVGMDGVRGWWGRGWSEGWVGRGGVRGGRVQAEMKEVV